MHPGLPWELWYADLTQLGEYLPYKQKVRSSSLLIRTNLWKGRLSVQQTNPWGANAQRTLIEVKSFGQKRPKIWNNCGGEKADAGRLSIFRFLSIKHSKAGWAVHWEIQVQILSTVSLPFRSQAVLPQCGFLPYMFREGALGLIAYEVGAPV